MSELPDTIFNGNTCMMCGALVYNSEGRYTSPVDWKESHKRFHDNMVSRKEARDMSSVRWCDNGDHPFKAGMKGAQSGTVVENVEDKNGNIVPKTVEVDICPEHTMAAMARTAAEDARKSILSEIRIGTPAGNPDGSPAYGSENV